MATFFTGLSTLPRTVLYIIAQCVGSIVGAYWLRLAMGESFFPTGVVPGCTVDPTLVSPGQMFVLEYVFGQALLFVAFGVGLEPRQAKVLGPAYSLVLVGFALSLATLASVLARPGYTGVCEFLMHFILGDRDVWLMISSFQPSKMSGTHGREGGYAVSLCALAGSIGCGVDECDLLSDRAAVC